MHTDKSHIVNIIGLYESVLKNSLSLAKRPYPALCNYTMTPYFDIASLSEVAERTNVSSS